MTLEELSNHELINLLESTVRNNPYDAQYIEEIREELYLRMEDDNEENN